MEQKLYHAKLDSLADSGEFVAVFATLNVIDADGDVTLPNAFGRQQVLIEPWNHNYNEPPVGRGEVYEEGGRALVRGRFFLDTAAGREHYAVVKNLGELQEWSYSFYVTDAEPGQYDDQPVRFLKKLDVIGVGPVARGAGVDTGTVAIKSGGAEEGKPYPSEHACRLRDPGDFQDDSFRRISRESDGRRYDVIVGRLEGETTMTEQAYRYPRDIWSEAQARRHCDEHGGDFEPAKPKYGARHTAKEYETIQQIHDLAVELGANCPGEETNDEAGDAGKSSDAPALELYRKKIEIEFM